MKELRDLNDLVNHRLSTPRHTWKFKIQVFSICSVLFSESGKSLGTAKIEELRLTAQGTLIQYHETIHRGTSLIRNTPPPRITTGP